MGFVVNFECKVSDNIFIASTYTVKVFIQKENGSRFPAKTTYASQ